MGGKVGRPRKFQREILRYRVLYESKNLRWVRDNWILYWRFLAHLEDIGYRPRTIEGYHCRLDKFLRWLEDKSVRRVRKQEVESYLQHHRQYRQRVAYTIRYERQALAMFFEWVMSFCRMKVNPAAGLRIRMYYNQPERLDLFSREETAVVIQAPVRALQRVNKEVFPTERAWREEIYRLKMHHLILRLMFSTGIRPCELTGLELRDFDRTDLRLRVRNKGNLQYIVSTRHVFISKCTKQKIEELVGLSASLRGSDSLERLFIHYHGGTPLASNYPNVVMKRWAIACGIARNVYAYMARYTYCTRLVENGVDLYSLRKLMGHKNIQVTLKHYLKLTPEEIRKEWKQFNPLAEGVS